MRKVKEIFYLADMEKSSQFSKGILLVLEDGTKVELMSTDIVADKITESK